MKFTLSLLFLCIFCANAYSIPLKSRFNNWWHNTATHDVKETFAFCSNFKSGMSHCAQKKKKWQAYTSVGLGVLEMMGRGGYVITGHIGTTLLPDGNVAQYYDRVSVIFRAPVMFGVDMRYKHFYQAIEIGFVANIYPNDHYPSFMLEFNGKYKAGFIVDLWSTNIKTFLLFGGGIGQTYRQRFGGHEMVELPEGTPVGTLFGGVGMAAQLNGGLEVGVEIAFGALHTASKGFFTGQYNAVDADSLSELMKTVRVLFYPSFYVKMYF